MWCVGWRVGDQFFTLLSIRAPRREEGSQGASKPGFKPGHTSDKTPEAPPFSSSSVLPIKHSGCLPGNLSQFRLLTESSYTPGGSAPSPKAPVETATPSILLAKLLSPMAPAILLPVATRSLPWCLGELPGLKVLMLRAGLQVRPQKSAVCCRAQGQLIST